MQQITSQGAPILQAVSEDKSQAASISGKTDEQVIKENGVHFLGEERTVQFRSVPFR